jgi:hypothetical protein
MGCELSGLRAWKVNSASVEPCFENKWSPKTGFEAGSTPSVEKRLVVRLCHPVAQSGTLVKRSRKAESTNPRATWDEIRGGYEGTTDPCKIGSMGATPIRSIGC